MGPPDRSKTIINRWALNVKHRYQTTENNDRMERDVPAAEACWQTVLSECAAQWDFAGSHNLLTSPSTSASLSSSDHIGLRYVAPVGVLLLRRLIEFCINSLCFSSLSALRPLGRCWNHFCSDWQMCIGHGIRVAARAFVTFVKGRLKCLLLLLLLSTSTSKK